MVHLATPESVARNPSLPHCCTRRTRGCVLKMRTYGRLISYNSCRNRHCPKCQANARDRWLEARGKELLPTRYVHVVFTLPRQVSPLALQNKREIYALLFQASAETLLQIARDPQRLGAEIGFFSVLHTWNQKLQHHPHVIVWFPPAGCLRIIRGGSTRSRTSSCRLTYSKRSSGASSCMASKRCMRSTNSPSMEHLPRCRIRKPSQRGFARYSAPTGWFTQNAHSAAPNTRFAIWANIPIV
jgi:hypothetical protein